MALRSGCRRASGLMGPCCSEGVVTAQKVQTVGGSSTFATMASASSSASSSSSSSSMTAARRPSPRRTSRQTQHQQTCRPMMQQGSVLSGSLAQFSTTSSARNVPSTPAMGSALTPQQTTQEVRQWFHDHYDVLDLPDAVLLQLITHESWDNGIGLSGHNRRLSFLGRRAMQMFLSIFLHARLRETTARTAGETSTSSSSSSLAAVLQLLSSNSELEAVLQTSRLGDGVGRALKLDEVMRWTPAVSDGQVGPKETGLFKIRGVTVEALVGAVYHHHGAAAARAFFDARILPNLQSLPADAQAELQSSIETAAAAGEAALTDLRKGHGATQAQAQVQGADVGAIGGGQQASQSSARTASSTRRSPPLATGHIDVTAGSGRHSNSSNNNISSAEASAPLS